MMWAPAFVHVGNLLPKCDAWTASNLLHRFPRLVLCWDRQVFADRLE